MHKSNIDRHTNGRNNTRERLLEDALDSEDLAVVELGKTGCGETAGKHSLDHLLLHLHMRV